MKHHQNGRDIAQTQQIVYTATNHCKISPDTIEASQTLTSHNQTKHKQINKTNFITIKESKINT
jgi:hypothetical protein